MTRNPAEKFSAIIIILTAGLLLLAARGDLWLDEIWSVRFATAARHPWDIFRFTHDNNHILNTLYLYLIGKQPFFIVYRLLSISTAIGALIVTGRIATRQWGAVEGILVLILTGTAFPFILYGSEARGYAPVLFFTVATVATLQPALKHACHPDGGQTHPLKPYELTTRVTVFWVLSIFGILSHATFIMVLVAFLSYALFQILIWPMAGNDLTGIIRPIMACIIFFSVPVIFLIFFYFLFLHHMVLGGGPVYKTGMVIGRAAAMLLGLPDTGFFRSTALAVAGIIVITGTMVLYQQKNRLWVFFPVMLVIAPALVLVVTAPTYLYFRYFIICLPFFYLLLARTLAVFYRFIAGKNPFAATALVALVMALFITGQTVRIIPLIVHGRGHYRAALTEIAEQAANLPVTIGSDHDFRNKLLIRFYADIEGLSGKLQYVDETAWEYAPPDWFIAHAQDRTATPRQHVTIPRAGRFRLAATYDYGGISGWRWFVYKRE